MPKDPLDNRYRGQTLGGVRHGHGTYSYPNGGNAMFTYEGGYKNGVKSGGKLTIAGISTYEGEFDDYGEITGKGRRTWNDGRVYEGDFVKGQQTGYGKWEKKSKDFITGEESYECYEGNFIDNIRQGQGKYTDGKVTYEGDFLYHKFQGDAVVTGQSETGGFRLNSHFNNNRITGKGKVTFSAEDGREVSVLSCASWQEGQPSGPGSYISLDSSYIFRGNFKEGLPEERETSSYLWADIDRAELMAQEEAETEAALVAAGGKPGKKAPPKKGDEGPKELLVPFGRGIGSLAVRNGGAALVRQQMAEIEAAASDPKAAKGKGKGSDAPVLAEGEAPPQPIPPESDPIPCELQRKFKLTLRRVEPPAATENTEEASGEEEEEDKKEKEGSVATVYSDPIPFWLRNQSQEEMASDHARFPCDSYVYNAGRLATAPPLLPPPTPLDAKEAPQRVIIGEPSDELALEEGAQAAASDERGSSVMCHAIPTAGGSVSFTCLTDGIPGASEALTFTADFKMDPAEIEARHVAAELSRRSRTAAAGEGAEARDAPAEEAVGEEAREQTSGVTTAPMDDGKGTLADLVQAAELPAPFAEVSVLTLSRVYDGEEVSNGKGLSLVMLVPAENFTGTDSLTNTSGDAHAVAEESGEAGGSPEGRGIPQAMPAKRSRWENILLELRLSDTGQKSSLIDCSRTIMQWAVEESMDTGAWHSIALNLDATSPVVGVALDGAFLQRSNAHTFASAEVDEGAALAWLPEDITRREAREEGERQATKAGQAASATVTSNQDGEEVGNGEAIDDQTEAVTPTVSASTPERLPRMRVRGGGPGFSGAIKLLALVAPSTAPNHSILESTRVYAMWAAREEGWSEFKRRDWYSRAVLQAKQEASAERNRREEVQRRIAAAQEVEDKRLAALESATSTQATNEGDVEDPQGTSIPAPSDDPEAAVFAQNLAELQSELEARRPRESYVKVMDVPRDCQAVYETFVRTRKGSTPLPLTRVLITADTPPGDYVLAVEDVVDNALVQGQDEHDQKTTMLERETAHALRLTAAEASLEEALASAPAPSEGDPEGCEHETVVVARAALAEAQRPLAPVPRPLSDVGGMLRQVPRLATFYVPFKVFDPASVAEG